MTTADVSLDALYDARPAAQHREQRVALRPLTWAFVGALGMATAIGLAGQWLAPALVVSF